MGTHVQAWIETNGDGDPCVRFQTNDYKSDYPGREKDTYPNSSFPDCDKQFGSNNRGNN